MSEAIRVIRERGGMSTKIARALHVTPGAVSGWLNGHRPIPAERLDGIANSLGMDDLSRRELHRAAARGRGYDV
jgi:transcriptional regulator with XRE-family HTH domain